MDLTPNDRLSKLPPSPSNYSTIQRKSFVKISSSNDIPVSQLDNAKSSLLDGRLNANNVRRIPIFRSTSTTPDRQSLDKAIPEFESILDRINQFGLNDLRIRLTRVPSRQDHSPLLVTSRHFADGNSTSSGYRSSSNSSLSYHSGSTPLHGTLRRVPSVNYLYPTKNIPSNQSDDERQKANRFSFHERSSKDNLISVMDKVEKRIAFFRQVACELLEERAKLQDALKQIHTSGQLSLLTELDRQDIQASVDCLQHRLDCVDVSIEPVRSREQIEALKRTNQSIEQLHQTLDSEGKTAAMKRCMAYINSCTSDYESDSNNNEVMRTAAIDEKFQKMIIGCSLEDQKAIRKKLKNVLHEIESTQG